VAEDVEDDVVAEVAAREVLAVGYNGG